MHAQAALQESVSQVHIPPVVEATGASTECMSAEEVLLPKKWKQQQVYSWRFDPRELVAQPRPVGGAQGAEGRENAPRA